MSRTRLLVVGLAAAAVVAAGVALVVVIWSEDVSPAHGDLIAYSCKEQNNPWFAICVMKSDGSGKRRLTSKIAATDPSWSPDGRRLAFTHNRLVGDFTQFTDDDVFVVDADGDDVRQVTTHRTGRSAWQPAWAPDGDRIVYVNGGSVASGVPSRFGALFVVAADGSDPQRLTRSIVDTNPAWSPDGQDIAFSRCERYASEPPRCAHELFVIHPDGTGVRRLSSTPRLSEVAPAWSPDGSRIAFVLLAPIDALELRGKEGLYVMSRDGGGVKRVVEQHYIEADVAGLAWSPDGRTIALETKPQLDCTAISLVDVSSRKVRPLTSCTRPRESALSPAWQPDTTAGTGAR